MKRIGCVVLIAVPLLLAGAAVWMFAHARHVRYEKLLGAAKGQGITVEQLESWDQVWPTLAFPKRAETPPPGVEVRYDAFDDWTTVEMVIQLDEAHVLTFGRVRVGKSPFDPAPPPSVFIGIPGYSWQMIFLAGETRIRAEGMQSVFDILRDRKGELSAPYGSFVVYTPDFLRICESPTVAVRVDDADFTLTPSQIGQLRAWASMLRE